MIAQKRLNVFISSTTKDLKEYREAAREAVLQLGLRPIIFEEFPAISSDVMTASRQMIDQADIFIGIYAYRYGWIPPDSELSGIEMEFNWATEKGIPRLCFFVSPDAPWPPTYVDQDENQARLRNFKDRILSTLVVGFFTSPQDLQTKIVRSLQGLLGEASEQAAEPEASPAETPPAPPEKPPTGPVSDEGLARDPNLGKPGGAPAQPPRPSIAYQIATRALSDRATDQDLLGFDLYAEAMARFILSKDTGKPLTIAIDAPWGMGKTSLMYMIRRRLIEQTRQEISTRWDKRFQRWHLGRPRQFWKNLPANWQKTRTGWYRRLYRTCRRRRLRWVMGVWKARPRLFRREPDLSPDAITRRAPLTTVWFNAWKYDQEEALWAALALTVIDQVGRQLGFFKRSAFWFRLNSRRFDSERFMRTVRDAAVYGLLATVLGMAVIIMASLWLGNTLQTAIQQSAISALLGGVIVMYRLGKQIATSLMSLLDLKLEKYIQQPNYQERVGFLSEFERDFERLVSVVTQAGKRPLVIFIDDLDRCAVPKAVEIVEAINLFLDAAHCVFVIGMDSQTVAASIEVRYEKLKQQLETEHPSGLSLGRYFLEKIIQINFRLPQPDPKLLDTFTTSSLGKGKRFARPPVNAPGHTQAVEAIKERAQEALGNSLDFVAVKAAVQDAQQQIPQASQAAVQQAQQEIIETQFDNLQEVKEAIASVVEYLGFNPRRVKRFINAFRLHAYIVNRQGLLSNGSIDLSWLAKWLVAAMIWPDFVEAMRASREFDDNLLDAFEIRNRLGGSGQDEQQARKDKAHLETYLRNPAIKRLIDAPELIRFASQTKELDDHQVFPYLYLANMAVNSSTAVPTPAAANDSP